MDPTQSPSRLVSRLLRIHCGRGSFKKKWQKSTHAHTSSSVESPYQKRPKFSRGWKRLESLVCKAPFQSDSSPELVELKNSINKQIEMSNANYIYICTSSPKRVLWLVLCLDTYKHQTTCLGCVWKNGLVKAQP